MKKRDKIIYWIATVWLALGMISTGAVQLLLQKEGAGGLDTINHLGYPTYILYILGTAKILGVIAILIPRFPLIKEWAYAGFIFTMSGAIISHLVVSDGAKILFGPVLLLVLTFVSWYFRPADRKIVPNQMAIN